MSAAPARVLRRTQAERSSATRLLLVDATVDCLVEFGYGGLTTSRVVERAGVSRGAQLHHYPTKSSLVIAALEHLADQRIFEFGNAADRLPADRGRIHAALELMWEAFTSPLFRAALELWVAARTDAELRAALIPRERDIGRRIHEVCADVFGPQIASHPNFRVAVDLILNTMRGGALVGVLEPRPKHWEQQMAVLTQALEVILRDETEDAGER